MITTVRRDSSLKRALTLASGATLFWSVGFLVTDGFLTGAWTISGAHSKSARVSIGVLVAAVSATLTGLLVFVSALAVPPRGVGVREVCLLSFIASVMAAGLPWKAAQHPFVLLGLPMAVVPVVLWAINQRRGNSGQGVSS